LKYPSPEGFQPGHRKTSEHTASHRFSAWLAARFHESDILHMSSLPIHTIIVQQQSPASQSVKSQQMNYTSFSISLASLFSAFGEF